MLDILIATHLKQQVVTLFVGVIHNMQEKNSNQSMELILLKLLLVMNAGKRGAITEEVA